MKVKYYAKQVNPEWQEDNLFYTYKNKKTGKYEMGMNDDYYYDKIIIYGNKEFHSFTTKEFDNLMQLDSVYYEYEPLTNKYTNHCYWDNITQFVNAYFPKQNGRYSKQEIHQWKLLLEEYSQHWRMEEITEKALELMTGKKWHSFVMRGYSQGDYQYGYASEKITDKDINYIEMCYFNTGSEYIVYESEEDFQNEDNGCSYYCDSFHSKAYLAEMLGCEEEEIEMYNYTGYIKVPQYEKV